MVCHAVSCLGWRGCFAYCIGSVRVLVRTPYDPKDLGTATPSVRKVISKHGAVPSSAEALSWGCLAATQRPCGLMHLTEAPRVPPLPVLSRETRGVGLSSSACFRVGRALRPSSHKGIGSGTEAVIPYVCGWLSLRGSLTTALKPLPSGVIPWLIGLPLRCVGCGSHGGRACARVLVCGGGAHPSPVDLQQRRRRVRAE